ncbi:MAG: hypothetical protein M1839_004282 [Geoglossum umbratile]|nr:MAG: hypothetical protein M1839_004282 [Geoglossum umbratile]
MPDPPPSPTTPHTLAFPLPSSPTTTLHIHLTPLTHTLLLFLTTSTPSTATPPSLGSFVYAIPSRTDVPLTTPLYLREGTVEFATRMARVLCRRTGKPVYVGWSGEVEGVAGTVEEEVQGWRLVVDVVMEVVGK